MRFAVAVLLGLLAAVPLDAHDFWVEPSQYRPVPGSLVGVRLLVGDRMLGDPVPRSASALERFVVADQAGEAAVPGREGMHPAGVVRVQAPGTIVVGYHSRPQPVELSPDKFAQYLEEEGLGEIKAVLAARPARGVVRELFSRCAKAILQSGPVGVDPGDRRLGFPLELLAEQSPYAVGVGRPLTVVLTYLGQPKRDALVVAINQQDPLVRVTTRTDRMGRAALTLPRAGVWLVKSVHMVPSRTPATADWESFWASLTFDLPGADAGAGTAVQSSSRLATPGAGRASR